MSLAEINLDKDEYSSIMALHNGFVIYNRIDDGTITYFLLNVQSGEKKTVGSVNNFLISKENFVVVGDSIYFFVTVSSDGGNKENKFYELNIQESSLYELYSESNMQTFSYMDVSDGIIYATKGKMISSDSGETYIETYNVKNRTRSVVVNSIIEYTAGNGQVITNMDIDNNKIYAVVEAVESGNSTFYIYIYSLDGEFLECIDMSEYNDDIFSTMIAELHVNDNYIYLLNFSSEALLGRVDNGKFVPIEIEGEKLFIVKNNYTETENIIFYRRRTDKIYILDKKSGNFTEKKIVHTGEDSSISYITQDEGENLLIYLLNSEDAELSSLNLINIKDI